MTNERAQCGIRRVAKQYVDVVNEHGLGVDANTTATRRFQDDLGNHRRVHAPKRQLPPPSVPRDMGVEADGMVPTTCPHSEILRVG